MVGRCWGENSSYNGQPWWGTEHGLKLVSFYLCASLFTAMFHLIFLVVRGTDPKRFDLKLRNKKWNLHRVKALTSAASTNFGQCKNIGPSHWYCILLYRYFFALLLSFSQAVFSVRVPKRESEVLRLGLISFSFFTILTHLLLYNVGGSFRESRNDQYASHGSHWSWMFKLC